MFVLKKLTFKIVTSRESMVKIKTCLECSLNDGLDMVGELAEGGPAAGAQGGVRLYIGLREGEEGVVEHVKGGGDEVGGNGEGRTEVVDGVHNGFIHYLLQTSRDKPNNASSKNKPDNYMDQG